MFIAAATVVSAQKTEISASLNSGLFSFSGSGAEKTSSMNVSDPGREGYTNNPYGSKNGLSYGLSVKIQQVFKQKIIIGAGLGYEMLRSKISLNRVSITPYDIGFTVQNNATGKTNLNSQFINLDIFGGYRFDHKKIRLDVTGGFDIAYCAKAMEKGKAKTTAGEIFTTSIDRKTTSIDFRPRLQLAASYKKVGVYLGYSLGLNDYKNNYIGIYNKYTYARLIRFGLTYRLK